MRIISTYTGAGGLDIGFHDVNAEVVNACELNKHACDTYSANFPRVPLFRGKVIDALDSGFFAADADVLIGGPPCQGFSVAGKMDPEDPRSLEIFTFLKVLKKTNPQAFVMENVKALATLSKWEFVRERILAQASKAGYEVEMHVLNSEHYGVPQRRERVFFIGFSTKHGKNSAKAALAAFNRKLAKKTETPKPLKSIVRNLGPAGSQGNSRVCNAKVNFTLRPIMRRSPYAGMLFNGAGRPVNPDGVCPTLPASMGGNKTPIVDEAQIFDGKDSFVEAYHSDLMKGGAPRSGQAPSCLRRLTIDECIAVQTFPADYEFCGSNSSIFKQIGNAVPAKMGKAIAISVQAGFRVLVSQSKSIASN